MSRLNTKEVKIGGLKIGQNNPILVQTMTTKDTMDTQATVDETLRCVAAGAEIVRITAPSKKEAENLKYIKEKLIEKGCTVPLVADIHYTPNAAEIAATIVEKVRINPGNFVDKKKFEEKEYTDKDYAEELKKIEQKFIQLLNICKENNTSIRIGTNHGSLSDRIMNRFGDTSHGMVESAMEFLRIARKENFHEIVLSMKSSNPIVMIDAYRSLTDAMLEEFGECYPMHLGVTEAGDGEDGRIKSAIGIGTLLEDGIGDTIRVSLTENPEFEIPVCNIIVERYNTDERYFSDIKDIHKKIEERKTNEILNIGGNHVPVVITTIENISSTEDFEKAGYIYNKESDKWNAQLQAADFIFIKNKIEKNIAIPQNIKFVIPCDNYREDDTGYFPLYKYEEHKAIKENEICFLEINTTEIFESNTFYQNTILVLEISEKDRLKKLREIKNHLIKNKISNPIILKSKTESTDTERKIIHHSIQTGSPMIEGLGNGLWLEETDNNEKKSMVNISFGILQAVRKRISKTEYISCPSCGRTLFDLQETTSKIKSATEHLKGVKIAIMGCIVNGPGEMADADFGYVGSGVGKISLYKGKEVVKKNVNSENAVNELIELLKENEAWEEK